MLLFPLDGLLDEQACHDWLLHALHPAGLSCPQGHRLPDGQRPHDRHRAPVMDYRCRQCGAVYNLFTGTLLTGVRWPCSTVLLMLRGFAQGTPTKHLAQELGADRAQLLAWRHRTQALLAERLPPLGPAGRRGRGRRAVPERGRDENEKGRAHRDPADPPRRRANKRRGHGTFDNDRPPVAGVVGRASGQVRLRVVGHSDRRELEPFVVGKTVAPATVNTDEWGAYDHLPETGRDRKAVCHAPGKREWARDEDGDGVREVHCNTMEGIWTGLRNFLRPFRGVSKHFLASYVAVFEWAHNRKRVTGDLIQAMVLCTFKAT